jgi:hypothetical protein
MSVVVYYESMKRKLKTKPIYECRCNGRLQTKRFTRLSHTGLVVELEHRKKKPPTDGGDLTISGNLKSFEGPVLKCRDSTERRGLYLNELVFHSGKHKIVFRDPNGTRDFCSGTKRQ